MLLHVCLFDYYYLPNSYISHCDRGTGFHVLSKSVFRDFVPRRRTIAIVDISKPISLCTTETIEISN